MPVIPGIVLTAVVTGLYVRNIPVDWEPSKKYTNPERPTLIPPGVLSVALVPKPSVDPDVAFPATVVTTVVVRFIARNLLLFISLTYKILSEASISFP